MRRLAPAARMGIRYRHPYPGVLKQLGAANRYEIAQVIGARVHAFERHVPPVRRLWMREDERIGLFGAASLAMTFYHQYGQGLMSDG